MTTTNDTDAMAARLEELRKVRSVLWGDRDDPTVLSELVTVQNRILTLERELGIRRTDLYTPKGH